MPYLKKCSYCGAEVDNEDTVVKSGTVSGGIILPSMQVDENGMGPDVKECWNKGICPCCLHPTLKHIENSEEKGE
jgi:hypothetical protein